MRGIWLLLLVSSVAQAATPAEIRARGRLVVSVKNEGPRSIAAHKDPAHFEKRGFEVELARALAKAVVGDADKLELALLPRPVRLFAVAEDRVDLVISMIAITDEAKRQVDFSRPYLESGIALLVRPDARLDRLEDLAGKKLLAIRQSSNDPAAELARAAAARGVRFQLERVTSFADAAQRISAGAGDGLVSEAINIDAWLAAHPGLRRTRLLVAQQFAVAAKKGNAALLAIVNETLDRLARSGELSAMQKRAGLDAAPPSP